jgi:hypothetical protein
VKPSYLNGVCLTVSGMQVKMNLRCKGWIFPANTIVFFLSSIYAAQNKTGTGQPEKFDGAYLMTRYKSEYDMPEIPRFVKKQSSHLLTWWEGY